MYNTIKYSFGEIQNAAADIQNTSRSIDGLLGDLKRQLEPMVATWEGRIRICVSGGAGEVGQCCGGSEQYLGHHRHHRVGGQ